MKYKYIRIFFTIAIACTIFSAGCSIAVTRNYYYVKPKTLNETDSTAYALQLSAHQLKSNNGQR